jgi:broad specificity phosphatase PhoE
MAIYLIRHGKTETPWVEHADSKLSTLGQDQACALVESWSFSAPRKVVSSPLKRALETAQPLADHYGVDVEVMDSFGEIPARKLGIQKESPFSKG